MLDYRYMPKQINIIHAKDCLHDVEDALKDGYLAFAYPGKFLGYGETMEEALLMCKIRLRKVKNKYLEHHTEDEWCSFANSRGDKIDVAHSKWGIKDESTWNIDNLDKTT